MTITFLVVFFSLDSSFVNMLSWEGTVDKRTHADPASWLEEDFPRTELMQEKGTPRAISGRRVSPPMRVVYGVGAMALAPVVFVSWGWRQLFGLRPPAHTVWQDPREEMLRGVLFMSRVVLIVFWGALALLAMIVGTLVWVMWGHPEWLSSL